MAKMARTLRRKHEHATGGRGTRGGLSADLVAAHALVEEGRLEEARRMLTRLAHREPSRVDVLGTLANVCMDLEDIDGTARALERLHALERDEPQHLLSLAGCLLALVRPTLARDAFARFLERWPDHPRATEARKTLADLSRFLEEQRLQMGLPADISDAILRDHDLVQQCITRRETSEGMSVGRRLLARHEFVPAMNNMGLLMWMDGDWTGAIEMAGRVLAIDPRNVQALANRIRFLALTGRAEEAKQAAEDLKKLPCDSPGVWAKKAEGLSWIADDEAILELLREFERKKPRVDEPALIHHHAGVAACRLGQVKLARAQWTKALQLRPGLEMARLNLADLDLPVGERNGPCSVSTLECLPAAIMADLDSLHGQGRTKDSDLTERMLRWARRMPQVLRLVPHLLDRGDQGGRALALAMAAESDVPEVVEALKRFALGQAGSDHMRMWAAETLVNRGLAVSNEMRLYQQGQWQITVFHFRELHDEPTVRHGPAITRMARQACALLREGKAAEAEAILREALCHEPDAPDLQHNLAVARLEQGQKGEALDLLRRVHEAHPDYLMAAVSVATGKAKSGDCAGARAILKPLEARTRLHPTEYACLCQGEIRVSLAEGNPEDAKTWLGLWSELLPDDDQIPELRRLIETEPRAARGRARSRPGAPPGLWARFLRFVGLGGA